MNHNKEEEVNITNTTRALKATEAIDQFGGLERPSFGHASRVVTTEDLRSVLDLCSRLKLDIPAELADALEDTARICQRAHQLATTAPGYTADDLAADDYEERFIAAMTAQLRVLAKADELITRAKTPAIAKAAATARQHSQALIKLLNTVYAKHAQAPLGAEMREVHNTLLSWQSNLGQAMDGHQEWCMQFAWPQDAWNTLASRTRLPGHPAPRGVSDFDHALACGAKPYLALSLKDAETRYQHHREEYRAWEDAQAIARTQAYVQAETNRAIQEAQREQNRDRADALAYIREADDAIKAL
jgi:hypothetical protein